MAALNKIGELIGNLSSGDAELLRQLQGELAKQHEALFSAAGHLDALLNQLEPARHSLGFLHVLSVMAVTVAENNPPAFVDATIRFLLQCNAVQIRYDPKKFRLVCQKLIDIAVDQGICIRVLQALKAAIWKIGGEGSTQLTPQHVMFVQACIKAKCYTYALPVLGHFVYQVDPDLTAVEGEDTRLYFYYGGIVYLACKQFPKAIELFELVVSVPAVVGSAIMVAAYKKYLLCSLIAYGEVSSPPKYTNPSLLRLFKQIAVPYEEFATSFATKSIEDLQKVVNNHRGKYKQDSNLGLVMQAVDALTEQNIQRLTKTYITLSLADIAKQVNLSGPEEAEAKVRSMIDSGKVFATISQQDGMVAFKENPESYDQDNTVDFFNTQLQATIKLNASIVREDEAISLSQRYMQKVLQMDRGGPARVDPMDVGGSPATPDLGFKG